MSVHARRARQLAAWGLALGLGAQGTRAGAEGSAAAQAQGQQASPCGLTTSVEKREVAIGEPFTVELKGSGPAGATWTFPPQAESESVELRAIREQSGALPAGTARYQAKAFALGETALPVVEGKCRLADGSEHVVRSAAVALRMLSGLPKDPQEQKLADIRAPLPLGIGRAFWFAVSAVVLLCAGLAYVVWRSTRRRRPRLPAAEAGLAPDAEARTALARLAGAPRRTRSEYRELYIALAQIAKRYLERRLAAPILEMTSTETLAFLRQNERGAPCGSVVRDLTIAADRVKFANGSATEEQAERHLRVVAEMIDVLEARLRPAPASTPGRVA